MRTRFPASSDRIRYVEDVTDWADWQKAYRFGVLLILPPPDIAESVDRLRERHDPASAAISPAHISVSKPLNRRLDRAMIDQISEVVSRLRPFELRIDKPRSSTDFAGVFCPVYPNEAIDHVRDLIHRLIVFDSDEHERQRIPAHMTIAEFMSIEESQALCAQLTPETSSMSFMCDRLSLVVPDQAFRFRQSASFPLGRDD